MQLLCTLVTNAPRCIFYCALGLPYSLERISSWTLRPRPGPLPHLTCRPHRREVFLISRNICSLYYCYHCIYNHILCTFPSAGYTLHFALQRSIPQLRFRHSLTLRCYHNILLSLLLITYFTTFTVATFREIF